MFGVSPETVSEWFMLNELSLADIVEDELTSTGEVLETIAFPFVDSSVDQLNVRLVVFGVVVTPVKNCAGVTTLFGELGVPSVWFVVNDMICDCVELPEESVIFTTKK